MNLLLHSIEHKYNLETVGSVVDFVSEVVRSNIYNISNVELELLVQDLCTTYNMEVPKVLNKNNMLGVVLRIYINSAGMQKAHSTVCNGMSCIHHESKIYFFDYRANILCGSIVNKDVMVLECSSEYIFVDAKYKKAYVYSIDFDLGLIGVYDIRELPCEYKEFRELENGNPLSVIIDRFKLHGCSNVFELFIKTRDMEVYDYIRANFSVAYHKVEDFLTDNYVRNKGLYSVCVDMLSVNDVHNNPVEDAFILWASWCLSNNAISGEIRDPDNAIYALSFSDMIYNHKSRVICIGDWDNIIISYGDDSSLVYFKEYKQVVVIRNRSMQGSDVWEFHGIK